MGKIRYIGSKSRIVNDISEILGKPQKGQRLIDLFCGTGVISETMGQQGWEILANDNLLSASMLTSARLMDESIIKFDKTGGYLNTIAFLNNLKGEEDFFYKQYSTSSNNNFNNPRPYFTEENAKKIDAIRNQIKEWDRFQYITTFEKTLLLADLIESSNQIANIAGTYGSFLKKFTASTLRPLTMTPRNLHKNQIQWSTSTKDAFELNTLPSDVVYIDPPYTKRQYAAYYHIPETIANEDKPIVEGVTGLRPWKKKASVFCYKTKASSAMRELLEGINSKRILISYSSDGHISFEEMNEIAKSQGEYNVKLFSDFGRYSPNFTSRKNSLVRPLTEYLIDIRKQ